MCLHSYRPLAGGSPVAVAAKGLRSKHRLLVTGCGIHRGQRGAPNGNGKPVKPTIYGPSPDSIAWTTLRVAHTDHSPDGDVWSPFRLTGTRGSEATQDAES